MEFLLSCGLQFLERTFGYSTTIKIKDSFDFGDGVILGALILLWLTCKFLFSQFENLFNFNNVSIVTEANGMWCTLGTSNQAIISIGLISTFILTALSPIPRDALSTATNVDEFVELLLNSIIWVYGNLPEQLPQQHCRTPYRPS